MSQTETVQQASASVRNVIDSVDGLAGAVDDFANAITVASVRPYSRSLVAAAQSGAEAAVGIMACYALLTAGGAAIVGAVWLGRRAGRSAMNASTAFRARFNRTPPALAPSPYVVREAVAE